MCENSEDGLSEINMLRHCLGLEPISPPWHNCYFVDSMVEALNFPYCSLIGVEHFSSTYYFISRVINAALAIQENREPHYDDFINSLALKLPPLAQCAQVKLWIWEKHF